MLNGQRETRSELEITNEPNNPIDITVEKGGEDLVTKNSNTLSASNLMRGI